MYNRLGEEFTYALREAVDRFVGKAPAQTPFTLLKPKITHDGSWWVVAHGDLAGCGESPEVAVADFNARFSLGLPPLEFSHDKVEL